MNKITLIFIVAFISFYLYPSSNTVQFIVSEEHVSAPPSKSIVFIWGDSELYPYDSRYRLVPKLLVHFLDIDFNRYWYFVTPHQSVEYNLEIYKKMYHHDYNILFFTAHGVSRDTNVSEPSHPFTHSSKIPHFYYDCNRFALSDDLPHMPYNQLISNSAEVQLFDMALIFSCGFGLQGYSSQTSVSTHKDHYVITKCRQPGSSGRCLTNFNTGKASPHLQYINYCEDAWLTVPASTRLERERKDFLNRILKPGGLAFAEVGLSSSRDIQVMLEIARGIREGSIIQGEKTYIQLVHERIHKRYEDKNPVILESFLNQIPDGELPPDDFSRDAVPPNIVVLNRCGIWLEQNQDLIFP